MFGFHYFRKAGPTDHVVVFRRGQKRAEGLGLTFWAGPRTTAAIVPVNIQSIPFQVTEVTKDDQAVVVSGEITGIFNPEVALQLYDFTIDTETANYRSDGVERAQAMVRNRVPAAVRPLLAAVDLQEVIKNKAAIQQALAAALIGTAVDDLGVRVTDVAIHTITPSNAELARALEAEERERMLSKADMATADRRMNIAQKDRETRLYEAQTAEHLEAERAKLVDARVANQQKEAEGEAEAIKARLGAYEGADTQVLLAMAFQQMAAGHIGELNITPDLLTALTRGRDK